MMGEARTMDAWYRIVAAAMSMCSLPTASRDALDPAQALTRSFEDLGFDSLNFMEFCIAIHVETGIEITAATVDRLRSPDAVARHLNELHR